MVGLGESVKIAEDPLCKLKGYMSSFDPPLFIRHFLSLRVKPAIFSAPACAFNVQGLLSGVVVPYLKPSYAHDCA